MIGKFYFFIWELVNYPKIFFSKHFLWKTCRKGVPFIYSIKVYSHEKEIKYAKHLLTSWYSNPNFDSVETDTSSIVLVKGILREMIKTSKVPDTAYAGICHAIKNSHKHAWEIIIVELSKMTWHFSDFKGMVVSLLTDSNQKVRETALLVMEDGSFSKTEKKDYYSSMLGDKTKKVKERAIDMICRENQRFRNQLRPALSSMLASEKAPDIINILNFTLTKE